MLRVGRIVWFAIAVVAVAGGTSGCGDGRTVSQTLGAPCSAATQCNARCASGGDYPGGFCTVTCRHDSECPSGFESLCIDKAGGICLYGCTSGADCDFLGQGWTCRLEERMSGGTAKVCIGE